MWADATPNKWTISSRLLGEPRASGEGIAPFPYSTHFFICAKHLAQIMLSIVSEPFCLLVFVTSLIGKICFINTFPIN